MPALPWSSGLVARFDLTYVVCADEMTALEQNLEQDTGSEVLAFPASLIDQLGRLDRDARDGGHGTAKSADVFVEHSVLPISVSRRGRDGDKSKAT